MKNVVSKITALLLIVLSISSCTVNRRAHYHSDDVYFSTPQRPDVFLRRPPVNFIQRQQPIIIIFSEPKRNNVQRKVPLTPSPNSNPGRNAPIRKFNNN